MNSSQQPPSSWRAATDSPEFTKDPEETDDTAARFQQLMRDRGVEPWTEVPTLFEAIHDAWQKSRSRMTPGQKEVINEVKKDLRDPQTYVEYAVMITSLALLKRWRGWGIPKTLLVGVLANEAWSYIEDPQRYQRSYKIAMEELRRKR